MSDTSSSDSHLSAPLQGLSSDNKGPWVVVCAYIFILLSLMTIIIKLFTRFKATMRLTPNDIFIILAGFLGLMETITITIAVRYGLGRKGKNVSESHFVSFEKAMYTANILQIIVLAAAKASVTYLIIAINPSRKLVYSCYGILGLVGAWTIASVFALAFQCSPPHPWNSKGNTCVDRFAMNVGIQALNIITDCLIVVIPFVMMQSVQVSMSKRFVVSGLFAARLVVPAFTVPMLVYMKREYKTDTTDPTWTALVPQVFAQIMMNASIIAACIPSLKPFLADIKPGLIMINVPEHELSASFVRVSKSRSVDNGRTNKSGAVSRLASRLGLGSMAGRTANDTSSGSSGVWGEKQRQAAASMERGYNRPHATKARSKVENDRSESVKGLTDDVILHTIDYKVEYEDHTHEMDTTDNSSGSPRRERI
ncbi:hypothetical protein EDD36DRAFT_186931 [Exophiala viscosa]|uniref:Rhodopsin domain-containing protein n=1 Tax=Exophiala viscosa TaxID=2486360 RepID=A0AAN6E1I4_9EURO|nr:hypothetical protein EDD36DRAFT_186931 [Exophiala viscosa]